MPGTETRSILKKGPALQKKTLKFRPSLTSVRLISKKEENGNWRRQFSQSVKEHQNAKHEHAVETRQQAIEKHEKLIPVLRAIKEANNSEIEDVRNLKLTQSRRDLLAETFKPPTKEQQDKIASSIIQVSRSKGIPLETVLQSVKAASQSPPRSRVSRMWRSIKSFFSRSNSTSRSKGGTRKRKTKK
uniref:Uncharacterized protein n=1 Tax=viral metagenome TaxID=1070528 RepID=A0A6C0D3P7_9ZZZZ